MGMIINIFAGCVNVQGHKQMLTKGELKVLVEKELRASCRVEGTRILQTSCQRTWTQAEIPRWTSLSSQCLWLYSHLPVTSTLSRQDSTYALETRIPEGGTGSRSQASRKSLVAAVSLG